MSNFNDKELTQLLKRANISESVREGFMAKRRTLLKEAEEMKNKAYMEEMEEEENVYEANCEDGLDEAVESLEEELDMLAEMEDDDLMSEQEDDEDLDLDADMDADMDDPMDDSEMDLPDEDKADAEINVPEDLARSVIELADMLKGAMNLDDAPAEDMPMDEPLGDEADSDMPDVDLEDDTDMPEDEEEQLQDMVSRIVNRVAQRLIKESKKA